MAEIPGQQRLKRGKFTMGAGDARQFEPVAWAQRAAVDYTKRLGQGRYMPHKDFNALSTLQVDPERGHATMMAYRAAEGAPETPTARASYAAMRDETTAQYEHLTRPTDQGGMGLKHEVVDYDPYPTPGAMAADVSQGRIKTLSTAATGGHNFFSDKENDQFRATHDVFGHAATGRGFTRHGEEAAYLHHRQMYSDAAHEALTSETRGQNSYLNFHPEGANFPDQTQKLIGLPKWAEGVGHLTPPEPAPRRQHFEQGRLNF